MIYPLPQAQDQCVFRSQIIHRHIHLAKICDINLVLDDYGMEKWGRKAVVTQRLTNKLMILYQIPGRETFNRMCHSIDQMVYFLPYIRVQPDYPFKLSGVLYHDMNIPFENLVNASQNAVCDYRLPDRLTHLRDITPAISCPFALVDGSHITLPNEKESQISLENCIHTSRRFFKHAVSL